MNQFQESHLDFVLGLHRALAQETGTAGDLVWSPYSVASALGLAAAGARGRTFDELAAALAPDGELPVLGQALTESARVGKAESAVANALWTRTGVEFDDGYRRAVLGWPGGALHTADFGGDPEGARRAVNADVEKTTRGLVRELLAPGLISPAVVAVLVNALYLKVAWHIPFDKNATAPAPFHSPAGTREVPMMRQTERTPYAVADGWRMVTLPTAGGLAVDILLPEERAEPAGDGGAPAAAPPARETLSRLRDATTSTKIALSLPRFRIESHAVLNAALARLGVTAAFGRGADFSGMTTAERVWMDQVVHQAILDVDEEGFEGAAATAVTMRAVSFDLGKPIEFRVDRPFVLMVRHVETGAVFFAAQVTEP